MQILKFTLHSKFHYVHGDAGMRSLQGMVRQKRIVEAGTVAVANMELD